MPWLLEQTILTSILEAKQDNKGFSESQLSSFEMRGRTSGVTGSRITTVAKGVATISVEGVLTEHPDIYAYYFGGGNTTYRELRSALMEVQADDDVTDIMMNIASPGGSVEGYFETSDVMSQITKPITAVVSSQATSAAFGLAAQADRIEATSVGASFGSVGVAVDAYVSPHAVSVTSTKAPKKRPDVRTEAGVKAMREELDAVHDLFVSDIAQGRGTDSDTVNSDFGQGAVILAGDALKKGMIDHVESARKSEQSAPNSGGKKEAKSMNKDKYKAAHPTEYQAIMQEGIDKERDRAGGHLIMGEAFGALPQAIKAVTEGTEMTSVMSATYQAAGRNKQDVDDKAGDSADADPGSPESPAPGAGGGDDLQKKAASDNIFKGAAKQLNVKWEGVPNA